MALASDRVFVCNLLIGSVIKSSSSRVELANCGMRDGSSRSSSVPTPERLPVLTAAIVVNEFLVVAMPCNNTLCTELTIVSCRTLGRVLSQTMMTVMSACNAPVAMSLLESLCHGTTMKRSLHLHPMVTPCLSAPWDLAFRFQGCQWVHHSFRMLGSSWLPSRMMTFRVCRLARSTRSRHQPSCPPMSHTVSSRLLCSTLSTLEPVTVVAVSNVMR